MTGKVGGTPAWKITGTHKPTRRGRAQNNRPTRTPHLSNNGGAKPVLAPPTPNLPIWSSPCRPPLLRSARLRGKVGTPGDGDGGSFVQSTLRRGIEDVRRGDRCGVWGVPGRREERRRTDRSLTPMTTVSSPLNLGMNLSPRRISASLSGRNRHITLMLHSAGSAISARCKEGARGCWLGGLGGSGSAVPGRRPRTAHRSAPPAASHDSSQQLIANSAARTRPMGGSPSGSGDPPQLQSNPPAPVLLRAPGVHLPARDRPRGRRRCWRCSDLPGSGALSHPASRISTSRHLARPAPPPRPPARPPARVRPVGTSPRDRAPPPRGYERGAPRDM